MLTRNDYLMGRDKEYPLTSKMKENMDTLLELINKLSLACPFPFRVRSGYRPGRFNVACGGAPSSAHTTCEAIDLDDSWGEVDKWLTDAILAQYGLYREDPASTNGWCHLTTRSPRSGNRTFKP